MDKEFKKFLAALLILTLAVCGCAALKNALCSPTAEAVVAAGEKLALAEATLAYLQELVPIPEVELTIAGLKIAIPILRQIKNGICVSAEDEANASQVAVTSLKYAIVMGFSGGK